MNVNVYVYIYITSSLVFLVISLLLLFSESSISLPSFIGVQEGNGKKVNERS